MNANYNAILKEFVKWLDTLGYSNKTITDRKNRIHNFFEWLEGKRIIHISQMTDKHITEFQSYVETCPNKVYKGRMLGSLHINHYYIAIDKLLMFLYQYGMRNAPSPSNKRLREPDERILPFDVLTQQEIKTLYDSIPNSYQWGHFEDRQAREYETRLMFVLFYGCGLRRTEGCNLCIQDVDFDKRTVFVRQGKNYKDRIVPMSEGVYRELQDYIYNFRKQLKLDHNRLFIHTGGAMVKKLRHLQKNCNDETIKSKRITPHTLRHSIATHLLQNGMTIENIALFLGHSSLDSTQIYTHILND